MHLRHVALSILLTSAAIAGAQTGIVLDGSNYYFDPDYNYSPVGLAISERNEYVAAQATKSAGGELGAAIVSVNTGQRLLITSGDSVISGLQPVGFVNNVSEDDFANFDISPDFRIAGTQTTTNGAKVEYYGGGSGGVVGGGFDFEYTADGKDNDQALGVAPYPYAGYTAANMQFGTAGELAIFLTKAGATSPTVEMDDKDINPSMVGFGGNLILAAGVDNVADSPYAARASAYTINSSGTVSPAFTKTFSNTLSNHVFTKHVLKWGALSASFNVLVDNITVTNASNPDKVTTSYSYILRAYNASGSLLWTSPARTGLVAQISVGSMSNLYVLISLAPGQFLIAYDAKGGQSWIQPTKASLICACLSQGVVCASNQPTGSGSHPHVTIVKLDADGNQQYTVAFSSGSLNDDNATNLLWVNGFLYVAGQCANPGGQTGIFGAHWHQT